MPAFAIIGSLLVYFLPGMAVPRVMMLIFWVGYIMNIYYDKFNKYYRVIGVVSAILFSGLYGFWNEETMHYSASASVTIYHVLLGRHGYTIINLLMLIYRIILGTTGSLAIISLFHEFKNINGFIKLIGKSTAGIYVLQSLIIERGLHWVFEKYMNFDRLPILCNYILLLVISVILVVIINWLYQLIKRSAYVDFILFGSGKVIKNINRVS